MTIRLLAGVALLALGLAGAAAAAPYQPGMRTMTQQGGVEHGVQPRGPARYDRRLRRRGVGTRRPIRRQRSR